MQYAERAFHPHMICMHKVMLLSWRKGDTGMLISDCSVVFKLLLIFY